MRHLKGLGISRWGFAGPFYPASSCRTFRPTAGEVTGAGRNRPAPGGPYSESLGADVSTKAPSFSCLYIWVRFSGCWDLHVSPTSTGTRFVGRNVSGAGGRVGVAELPAGSRAPCCLSLLLSLCQFRLQVPNSGLGRQPALPLLLEGGYFLPRLGVVPAEDPRSHRMKRFSTVL